MTGGSLLLTLRQINICLGLYENEQLSDSGMTFAQVFLLNEIFSMDAPCVCSTELCERVGFARSSISRTLKELRKNGYVRMRMDQADNRKKRVLLTPKAYAARGSVQEYMAVVLSGRFRKAAWRGSRAPCKPFLTTYSRKHKA